MAHQGPIRMEMEEKTYAFCTCGNSQSYPFCDGAHKTTGGKPCLHACQKAGPAVVCGCRKSANYPWCDGSHKA